MKRTNIKHAIKDALALVAEVACYIALITLATNLVFDMNGVSGKWTSTLTYSVYGFTVLAIAANTFDTLLYFQLLIWAFGCKFIYTSAHPWQSTGVMCIGFAAIALNILIRRYKPKK